VVDTSTVLVISESAHHRKPEHGRHFLAGVRLSLTHEQHAWVTPSSGLPQRIGPRSRSSQSGQRGSGDNDGEVRVRKQWLGRTDQSETSCVDDHVLTRRIEIGQCL